MLNETAPLSVTELNEYARRLLAGDPLLRNVEVSGEISGYKHHYSGHRYFYLKDENARVQCVMFRQNAMGLDFAPADGMRVVARGAASLFTRDGSYQLYVSAMRKAGQGDLFARFEALKKKLQAEGLFDPARKRPIPTLPRVIGVATSETGAAIRDILQIARRRNPNAGILVAPCAVQGASAAGEIVRAIERLNRQGEADVLLVGRGGGSMEDLWAFNEEPVARAIAASRIPVISCVGHEIDFTIADFVADLRAPTPSAAAELAVPVLAELQAALDDTVKRLSRALENGQRMRRLKLDRACAASAMQRPSEALIAPRRAALELAGDRASRALPLTQQKARTRLEHAAASLRALDPSAVLERGYAVVSVGERLLTGVGDARPGQDITVRMADGRLGARVTIIQPGESKDGKEDHV